MRDVVNIHGYLLTRGYGVRLQPDSGKDSNRTRSERMVAELKKGCGRVTVIGPEIVLGANDRIEADFALAGPLVAISSIPWSLDPTFLLSSEIPNFDSRLISELGRFLEGQMAVIPEVGGQPQPFCALYSPQAFSLARRLISIGCRRVSVWLEELNPVYLVLDDNDLARCFSHDPTRSLRLF